MLRLCIDSIRENSQYRHQVILHINEGNDGTLDWVNEQPQLVDEVVLEQRLRELRAPGHEDVPLHVYLEPPDRRRDVAP